MRIFVVSFLKSEQMTNPIKLFGCVGGGVVLIYNFWTNNLEYLTSVKITIFYKLADTSFSVFNDGLYYKPNMVINDNSRVVSK
jgi:hypothetical protein